MTKHPGSIGAHAVCESLFSGTMTEVVGTLIEARSVGHTALYAGGKSAMLDALDALRKAGADTGAGCDDTAAAFLRKGRAIVEAELLTASGAELEWRLRAIGDCLASHRAWFKKASVTDFAPQPVQTVAAPVQVVSMPDRVSVQQVERDKEGEITSTTTVQKDFA